MQYSLFIPDKMKAGFQYRKDTFTGKLSYIIYYDEKNKLRKEKSWLNWCNSEINAVDFDNTPTSGFVINKDIQHCGDNFHYGRSMIRIYDPRGFEFEISIANLSLILDCSDTSKNEILGKLVYSIIGNELFLLPVNSQSYIESKKFTKLINSKMSTRNLVVGKTYRYKENYLSNYELIYLGYHNYNEYVIPNIYLLSYNKNKKKKHIYLQRQVINNVVKEKYITENINKIYDIESDIDNNIEHLVDNYFNSFYYKGITFKYEDINIKEYFTSFLKNYNYYTCLDKIPFFYKETDKLVIYLKAIIRQYSVVDKITNIKFKTYIFLKEDIKEKTIVNYIIDNYPQYSKLFTDTDCFPVDYWSSDFDMFYSTYYKDKKTDINLDNNLLPLLDKIEFQNYYSEENNTLIETNDEQNNFLDYLDKVGFKKSLLGKTNISSEYQLLT